MAVATTLVTLIVYLVIPSVLAATTYSRYSLDLARSEPNEQSARAGRKLSEVDFPTNLAEIPPIPVIQQHSQENPNVRRITLTNASRKPYKTVPVRVGRRGTSKSTQSMPDIVNDLVFDEKTPLAIPHRLRHRPRIPAGPYAHDNGFLRK